MGKITPEHAALLNIARVRRLGLEGYVRILAYLRRRAVTTAGISAHFNLCHNTAAKLLRYMLRLKLVHRESWMQPQPHSRLVPLWRLGAEGDVPMPAAEVPSRTPPNPMLIYLATVIELLRERPMTIAEIAEEIAMHKESAQRVVNLLREHGLSRIASFERQRYSAPVAQHGWLVSKDAPWPGRGCQVEARKRWRDTHNAKRRHMGLIAATAGAA